MPLYRATGNLVIRPCETCLALVLHEEGEVAHGDVDGAEAQPVRWRSFPHNVPGGAACIGGGSSRSRFVPAPKVARAAAAARQVRAPKGDGGAAKHR